MCVWVSAPTEATPPELNRLTTPPGTRKGAEEYRPKIYFAFLIVTIKSSVLSFGVPLSLILTTTFCRFLKRKSVSVSDIPRYFHPWCKYQIRDRSAFPRPRIAWICKIPYSSARLVGMCCFCGSCSWCKVYKCSCCQYNG